MASYRSQITKERSRIKKQLKRMRESGYQIDLDLSWSYAGDRATLDQIRALTKDVISKNAYWFNPVTKETISAAEATRFKHTKEWQDYVRNSENQGDETYNVLNAVEETINEGMNYGVSGENSLTFDWYAAGCRERAAELNRILKNAIDRDGRKVVALRMQQYAHLKTTVTVRIYDSKADNTTQEYIEFIMAVNGEPLDNATYKRLEEDSYSEEGE